LFKRAKEGGFVSEKSQGGKMRRRQNLLMHLKSGTRGDKEKGKGKKGDPLVLLGGAKR